MSRKNRVDSLEEYVKRVRSITDPWRKKYVPGWQPWFRGESNVKLETALVPRLYRPSTRKNRLLYLEQELRLEFRRRGVQLAPGIRPTSHWDWYFMMQHYQAPTRLLDWTDSSLVALYFAIEDDRAVDASDAAVYVLDPSWLNEFAYSGKGKNRSEGVALPDFKDAKKYLNKNEFKSQRLTPKAPLAIDPDHLSSRLAAQRSHFTIFGKEPKELQRLLRRKDSRIVTIRVPSNSVTGLRRELKTSGVTRSVIFPDLEGLGRELALWFLDAAALSKW